MSAGSGSGPLVPTFHGFVQNSMDGLVLFEACLSGKLHHVPRRPHDRERTTLIKSGSIFIYEENASGIKRWTDGVAWSPSRILGNFLIYRELEKPFPPGEKKRAMKRKRSSQIEDGPRGADGEPAADLSMPPTPPSPKPAPDTNADPAAGDNDRELDRQLIGSLVDSYGFRPDGLVKKTMSISINGVSHHLVSYYKVEDVKNRVLRRPMEDGRLAHIQVRPELYMKQNFRTPVEDTEHYMVDPNSYHHQGMAYNQMMPNGYMRPGQYPMHSPSYPMYGGAPASSATMYSPVAASGWQSAPPQHGSMHSGYSNQPYANSQSYSDYYSRTSSSTPQSGLVKTEEPGHSAAGYSHPASSPTAYSAPGARPAQPTYPSMQPQYNPPMRPTSASYASSSAVQHSAPAVAGGPPTQSYGQSTTPHAMYDTKPHGAPYTAPAPASSYNGQSAHHNSSTSQDLKSPQPSGGAASAAPHAPISTQMQYRSQYSGQEGANQNDVGTLGISNSYGATSHSAPAPYHGSGYGGYGASAQSYRPPIDGAATVSNQGQY